MHLFLAVCWFDCLCVCVCVLWTAHAVCSVARKVLEFGATWCSAAWLLQHMHRNVPEDEQSDMFLFALCVSAWDLRPMKSLFDLAFSSDASVCPGNHCLPPFRAGGAGWLVGRFSGRLTSSSSSSLVYESALHNTASIARENSMLPMYRSSILALYFCLSLSLSLPTITTFSDYSMNQTRTKNDSDSILFFPLY